jgi:hypothetical protein
VNGVGSGWIVAGCRHGAPEVAVYLGYLGAENFRVVYRGLVALSLAVGELAQLESGAQLSLHS